LFKLACERIGAKLWLWELSLGSSNRSLKVMAAQHKRSWKLREYMILQV